MAPSLYYPVVQQSFTRRKTIRFYLKLFFCLSISSRSSKSRKYCMERLLSSVLFPESSLNVVCTLVQLLFGKQNPNQVFQCQCRMYYHFSSTLCSVCIVTEYLINNSISIFERKMLPVLENSIELFFVVTSKLIKISGVLNKSKNLFQSILKNMVSNSMTLIF